MIDENVSIRRADRNEGEAPARISRISRCHFLPFLPDLHTLEEDIAYFSNVVLKEGETWFAQRDGNLIGFCSFRDGWLDHLYCLPDHVGKGVGVKLLEKAKEGQSYISLWVFQQNRRAIRFYERNGFSKTRETDGSGCEEQLPDALYCWQREPPASHAWD